MYAWTLGVDKTDGDEMFVAIVVRESKIGCSRRHETSKSVATAPIDLQRGPIAFYEARDE